MKVLMVWFLQMPHIKNIFIILKHRTLTWQTAKKHIFLNLFCFLPLGIWFLKVDSSVISFHEKRDLGFVLLFSNSAFRHRAWKCSEWMPRRAPHRDCPGTHCQSQGGKKGNWFGWLLQASGFILPSLHADCTLNPFEGKLSKSFSPCLRGPRPYGCPTREPCLKSDWAPATAWDPGKLTEARGSGRLMNHR